jgi:outer membrane receptor for ferrienterochelin and colicin
MQGLNENQSLILVDGQKYLGGMSGVDLATIPVNIIEKIEVVKGPSSVLYGSDAMGGVVNIITKSPIDRKSSFSLSGAAGSSDSQVVEARGNFSSGKAGGFLGFTHNHSDGRDAETDEIAENVLHGSLGYRFSPKAQLSIMPRYEYSKLTLDERIQKRFALNTRLDVKPDALTTVNLRAGIFDYRHQTGDGASDWDNDNYEVEAAASRLLFGSNLVTAGYHLMQETIDDRGKDYTADQTLHSFFLQDQIMIKVFTLTIGGRLDSHNLWDTQFNPKATLSVDLSEQFRLKGSVGRSFRGPKLVKLYAQYRMGPFMVYPNQDLLPETSIGYQIGADWTPTGFLSAGISYFYNDVQDLIQAVYTRGGPRPWKMTWENVENAVTQGVELSLRFNPIRNLLLKSGYTYLDTENLDTGEDLLERPRNSIFLVAGYKIPKTGTDVSIYFDYRGKRYAETENGLEQMDPYSLVDLSLSQKIFGSCKLFVRVYNLFNTEDVYDEYNIYGTRIMGGLQLGIQ